MGRLGPNEQNQHFVELRQKECLYIHALVLLRGLPSLEGKNKLFGGKGCSKPNSSQTDYIVRLPCTLMFKQIALNTK